MTGPPGGRPSWPEFLPGSEDFLFVSQLPRRGIEESEIYLATLREGRAADPVLLVTNASAEMLGDAALRAAGVDGEIERGMYQLGFLMGRSP